MPPMLSLLLADVRFYDVVVWVHVTAVVIGFGVTFAYPVIGSYVEKVEPRAATFFHRIQAAVGKKIILPMMLLILITGIHLTIDGPWSFGDAFVSFGLTALIVLILAFFYFYTPREEELAEIANRDMPPTAAGDIEPSDEYATKLKPLKIGGAAGSLLVVITIYFMVTKPFM